MNKLLPFFLSLLPIIAGAQYKLPENIATPNASDLGIFGEIPVSYYTGKADISIPLYTLTERGITLPVTLQYDASGVQMNSLPGWTGHNWVLNAGGCITRKLNHRCDEYIYPSHIHFSVETRNYFQSYSSLPTILAGDDSNYSHLKDSVLYNHNDFSPDIFYFNVMGISGRFFLGNDGEWKVFCEKNVEVIFDINDSSNYISPFISHYPKLDGNNSTYNQPKTIKGFILRDENGTEYHFGGSKDYIEYFTFFFRCGDCERETPWHANSWYLAKVKDRFGNELYHFTYDRGKFIVQFYNGCEDVLVNYQDPGWSSGMYNTSNKSFPYDAQLLSPIYLKKIETLSGGNTLHFTSEDTNIPMTTIFSSLYNSGQLSSNYLSLYVPHDTYNFHPFYYLQTNDADVTPYQYVGNDAGNKNDYPLASARLRKLTSIWMSTSPGSRNYSFEYSSSRPFLTKIKIMDARINYMPAQAKVAEYRFKYNHLDSLPTNYLTKAIDHWGYYNGFPYTIPTTTAEKWQFHNQRHPNAGKSLLGMLSEIVYPTGGKSVFVFEPNDFSKYLNASRTTMIDSVGLSGGVRIKSISEYDDTLGTTLLRSRTFTYQNPSNHTSSGELFAKPRYYWDNWTVWVGNASVSKQFFRSVSILPLSNSFGPHYGYSYVTETEGNKVTEYRYTNISDAKDEIYSPVFSQTTETPYDEFSERGYKRGKLLSVKIYDSSTLKKETNYTYRTDSVENRYVLTANLSFENPAPSGAYGHYNGGIFKLFYPKYDVAQESSQIYSAYSNPVIKTYTYTDNVLPVMYGNYTHHAEIRCLTNINTRISQPEIDEYFQYPHDFMDDCSEALASSFLVTPVSSSKYVEHDLISRKKTCFGSVNGIIVPFFETEIKPGFAATDTIVRYLGYNSSGLPTRYQRQGEAVTNLVWDTTGSHILAKIVGDVQPPSPSFNNNTTQQQMIDYFNNFRATTAAHVTSYTYDNNSLITSVTDALGQTSYFYYDLFNRLTDVRDNNGNLLKHYDYNYRNNQ